MSKIEINDLNDEVTLTEDSVRHVRGGSSFIKIDDISGESLRTASYSTFTLDGKGSDILWPSKWKV